VRGLADLGGSFLLREGDLAALGLEPVLGPALLSPQLALENRSLVARAELTVGVGQLKRAGLRLFVSGLDEGPLLQVLFIKVLAE
jgi:hypothetical protein